MSDGPPAGLANPAVKARRITCPKCSHVQKGGGAKCAKCSHDLLKARKALSAKVQEDAKSVGPHARKKLSPLIRHFMAKSHPFASCLRANRERFPLPGQAERICATLKDIGAGTTKWRKGPKKQVREEDVARNVGRLVEAGLTTFDAVDDVRRFLLTEVRSQPASARIALAEEAEARLALLAEAFPEEDVLRAARGGDLRESGLPAEVAEEAFSAVELMEAADLPRHRGGGWEDALRKKKRKKKAEGRESPDPFVPGGTPA